MTPLLSSALTRVLEGLPAARRASFEQYAHALYRHTPPDDVASEPAERHALRLKALWEWAAQYEAHREAAPKVRVYNPDPVGESWRWGGTFVEIVSVDRPFLVDSVTAELARLGIGVTLVQHPVFTITRDPQGALKELTTSRTGSDGRESWIHLTLERQPSEGLEAIRALLLKVLENVRIAVIDWPDMRGAMADAVAALPRELPPGVSPEDAGEFSRFCRWVDEDHFLFLGYRDYTLSADGRRLEPDLTAARGLLRDTDLIVLRGLQSFETLPPAVQDYIRHPDVLFVNKTQARSSVHRSAPYDLVGIRRFAPDGRLIGLRLFLGLFTSLAYSTLAQDVPWLRQKVTRILERSGCDPRGHNGKALIHILNNYPRDDLFLIDEESLFNICQGILMLADRIRTALFVWTDPFRRFVSCLIYTPRDRFDTDLRKSFIGLLEGALDGTCSSFSIDLTDSPLVRLRVVVSLPAQAPLPDVPALERRLVDLARGWDDRVADRLVSTLGVEKGLALRTRYAEAFGNLYRGLVPPERASDDITLIETDLATRPLALALYPLSDRPSQLHVRLFQRGEALTLSDVVPRLENMGLRILSEVPYRVTPRDSTTVWISELLAETRDGEPVDVADLTPRFRDAFYHLWEGALVDDSLNRLLLRPGLAWRDVAVLRAYARYLQQIGFSLSYAFISDTLRTHPDVTRRLVQLFHTLFDLAQQNAVPSTPSSEALKGEIEDQLNGIKNPSEDEVLRRYLNLITSTLRTNFHQTGEGGQPKPYLSFKLDSRRVTDLPLPRPLVEIWVYSPRVEGVHLRGGRVARGGLRWSDRRDDFRTEVLGLMKAQMVKNAVIVPVGSKGGFYCKSLPTDRLAQQKEVVACYQTFIRGLLDLTDNRVGQDVVPPPQLVRRDGDDPYLVVAADKGTAKFSDIANALSRDYGFWLGDAFASGGSAGYDHKGMGITARGAWESVKRHFRERGRNTQMELFTCVGVGDMAGDVFGNGLLRSPATLLVGAFNHAHIFLDPNPDPALSFAERKRLFDMAGSQWSDYDPAKISKGGGVHDRNAKSIPLSPEVRGRLGLTADRMTPTELIRALLSAPVDLLYLGGIGTYVKASDETHADVSDKANDALRINAADLRAKVVGEGANLGFTARARVEFARQGGAINSDAIDNSGGVDTSDHEVNLKIALQTEVAGGTLSEDERNRFLAGMTEDVAALVLRDNYLQPQALSLEQRQAPALLGAHARLIQLWEKEGRLDRVVERLPDDSHMAQRAQAGEGLTRPELALLLAHAKLAVCDDVLQSSLPDEPVMEADLFSYFPAAMQTRFPEAIRAHRLRREIVATTLANEIVNRMGPAFAHGLSERTGHSPVDVARAYLIVRHVFDLPHVWRGIEALDNKVPPTLQLDLLGKSQAFVARTTGALLQMAPRPIDVVGMVENLGPSLSALADQSSTLLPDALKAALKQARQNLLQQGVPEDLAARVALLDFLASGPDILVVGRMAGQPPEKAAAVYYAVGERFSLDMLRTQAQSLKVATHWQRQEALALAEDLFAAQQKLAVKVLVQAGGNVQAWSTANAANVARVDALLRDIQNNPHFDLSMLAMVGRGLRNLAGPL